MTDIKKLIQAMDAIEAKPKKSLNESALAECGDMPPAPMTNPGNPVTMSISLNASGKEHVADLLGMLKNAGMQAAPPESDPSMPMRLDIEKFRNVVDNGDQASPMAQAIEKSGMEEWENEPDEEYSDHKLMTKDLSGGINRPKKMYKPAAKGDNPMAAESIKDQLYKALSEKMSKPDFLDMDKDGNKKEPMKKALKDKKVKEAAKPDFLDMDKDGNKKEPMKKALKDKKKAPFKK